MAITRWNPTPEFNTMRRLMDRVFADDVLRSFGDWPENGTGQMPVDIAEQDNALIVKASVPGIPAEEIQVEVKDNVLTISGEMKQESETKEQNYFVKEHRYGRFERSLRLPVPVDQSGVQATLKNGVLTLTLPKQSTPNGNRIPVQAG